MANKDNKLVEESFGNTYGNNGDDWDEFAEQNKLKYSSQKKYQEMVAFMMKNSNAKALQDEINNANLSKKEKQKKLEELAKLKKDIEKKAINATQKYEQNAMAQATVDKKVSLLQEEQTALQSRKDSLAKEKEMALAAAKEMGMDKDAVLKEYAKKEKSINNEIRENQKQQNALNEGDGMQSLRDFKDEMKEAWDGMGDNGAIATLTQMTNIIKDFSLDSVLEDIDKAKKAAESKLKISKDELSDLQDEYENAKANGASDEELAELAKKIEDKQAEVEKNDKDLALKQAIDGVAKSVKQMTNMIGESYNAAFKEAENILTTYSAHVEARLQGSEKSYKGAMDKISTNLSVSPFVKTQNVIEKMREAVDQGIVYNLEQRAFLSEISDKIANTFDVFDSNLLRLIRLQQADTTAARLGMEAALTNFLNEMFEDSSYLNNGNSQAIAGMLIDASSTMTKEASTEFEFVVQKWMGSLTSVGIDSNTVNSLVEAINYLATGDVESLSNNTQMQTLLTMAASNAGLDYSKMLINGLNASDTNKLLESTVIYLKSIAEGSENMVVRSAYGDVLGMNMSDFSAISNLREEDISTISDTMMSYQDMNNELNNQFAQLIFRTTLPEMLSNAYNNAVFGVAQDMVNNPVTYARTKMLNFMESQDINMNIPFINAMGFGLDLNANVQDLLRLGLGVGQAFSLVGNIMGGLGSAGGLNLDAWGFEETTKRGSGIGFSTSTSLAQTSSSTYVTTQSSDDMQNSALNTATDDAEETKEITNKNTKSEYTFDDFFKAVIGEPASDWVTTQDMFIREVFQSDAVDSTYLSVRDATSNANFLSVKSGVGEESIRTTIINTPIPVILSGALAASNDQTANTNIAVISKALKDVFNSSFSMRIRSASGSELIPVDTELISNDNDKPTFNQTSSMAESQNSGYRPGAINWN